MDEKEPAEGLKREGFSHIFVWEDGPGTSYSDHTHETEMAHVILDGELTLTMAGGTVRRSRRSGALGKDGAESLPVFDRRAANERESVTVVIEVDIPRRGLKYPIMLPELLPLTRGREARRHGVHSGSYDGELRRREAAGCSRGWR